MHFETTCLDQASSLCSYCEELHLKIGNLLFVLHPFYYRLSSYSSMTPSHPFRNFAFMNLRFTGSAWIFCFAFFLSRLLFPFTPPPSASSSCRSSTPFCRRPLLASLA